MERIDKKTGARESLLSAATRLFTEKGYDAVSTREIAETAQVNLGAIQYHFGSKGKLFVETVKCLMGEQGSLPFELALQGPIDSRRHAAERLCRFIAFFLSYLLHPRGVQPCRLMFREVFSNASQDPEMLEALISSVVKDFSRPLVASLSAVLKHVDPQADDLELQQVSGSIAGQCFFYASHRPFIERMRGGDLGEAPLFESSVRHVARFTLRGLRCDEALIEQALKAIPAFEEIRRIGEKKELCGSRS